MIPAALQHYFSVHLWTSLHWRDHWITGTLLTFIVLMKNSAKAIITSYHETKETRVLPLYDCSWRPDTHRKGTLP